MNRFQFRIHMSDDFHPNKVEIVKFNRLPGMATCRQRLCSVYITQATEKCSAEVFFTKGEERNPARVEVACEGLIKNKTLDQEEALYQQYKTNQSLLSAHNLPGGCEGKSCTRHFHLTLMGTIPLYHGGRSPRSHGA